MGESVVVGRLVGGGHFCESVVVGSVENLSVVGGRWFIGGRWFWNTPPRLE